MITRKILILWISGACLLLFWYMQNQGAPLGYDHGAYKHLINLISNNNTQANLPQYLQYQFEPFSGVFFYSITALIGKEIFFGWGYPIIHIFIALSLFILGKNKKKYTLGSYIGLFLFFFSSIQYLNLWWGFGKQLFATFFLILLMRYYKKHVIACVLVFSCVALHRLTGFVAILYMLFTYVFSEKKGKDMSGLAVGIFFALVPYIGLFHEQVYPSLSALFGHPNKQIFIPTPYGTGFQPIQFWQYITPVLLMLLFGFTKNYSKKDINLRNPYLATALFLTIFVAFRCIAHTRMGSFLDIFIIIVISKLFYSSIQRKWIYIFLLVQLITWALFTNHWHKPVLTAQEHKNISELFRDIPSSVVPVALSGNTMSLMTGYTTKETYSTKQGVSNSIWSKTDKILIKKNKEILCEKFAKIPGKPFLYVGSYEDFVSIHNNPCLKQVKTWHNGARLFLYKREVF